MTYQPPPTFQTATGKTPPAVPSLSGSGAVPQLLPGQVNPWGGQNNRPLHLQDPTLDGRFGRTLWGNRVTLTGRVMHSITVDRPTILTPVGVCAAIIYYQAEKRPNWSGAATTFDVAQAPIKSNGHGICYLAAAGTWYVYLDTAGTALEVALIPTEDPGLAARFIAEGGNVTATAPATGHLSLAVAGTGTIAANRDRRAIMLLNTTGSGGNTTVIRLGFGTAPTAGAPPAGTGIALANFGSLMLSGDFCWRGQINVAGSTTVTTELDYVEFT